MTADDQKLKTINELGKLYDSFVDKKLLCDFFLEHALSFIEADKAFLFLSGNENKIWLESSVGADPEAAEEIKEDTVAAFMKGHPINEGDRMFLPLIVRNAPIGIACFTKKEGSEKFTEQSMVMASSLATQMAGSLKGIVLYEDNVRMERLAAIGQTVGVVMHEVKNIIQLAKFAEEFLRRGTEQMNEKHLKRGLAGVQKSLRDMDGFIYEMLSLTKDYKISPEKIDFSSIFEEIKNDFAEKTKFMKVDLRLEHDKTLGLIDGEARSLYRVLVNMTKNAIEAKDRNKEQSFIKLSTKSLNDTQYEITIEDNGLGMNEETRAKLFSAFFSTKGEKGTGLGLMIIDRTIKAHHGDIRIESKEGEGTKFILTLPKQIANENESPQEKAA